MAQLFGHEKLKVYQKGLGFAARRKTFVLNTAEGNGRFSGTDQVKFLGIAYKATVQSASLVDLVAADGCSAAPSLVEEGRDLLRRIAAMLRSLSKAVGDDT